MLRETASTIYWLMDCIKQNMSADSTLESACGYLNPVYDDSDWELPKPNSISEKEKETVISLFTRWVDDADLNFHHAHKAYKIYLYAVMGGDEKLVRTLNEVANKALVASLG